MKSSVKKILAIEILVLLVIISNFFVPYLFDKYRYLVFFLGIGVLIYFLTGIDIDKTPNEKPIFKKTLFYIMLYFILIYLLGLFIGYAKTIYSWSFTNLVKNIIPAITIIIVCEVLRYQFIRKSNNNKIVIILSYLIFVTLDVVLAFNTYDLSIKDDLYEFIGLIIMGSLIKNVLMTIYDIKSDFYNSIAYRILTEIYVFIIPIIPDLGPYVNSVLLIVLPTVLSVVVFSYKNKEQDKPKNKRKRNIIFTIVVFILLLLVGLNSGFFKYQSLVIGSNSMKNYLSKGDVVILKKLDSKERKKLKEGDVIVFKYEKKLIAHRINKIVKRDERDFYITKGDNNERVDEGAIDGKNVLGIVKIKIKSIGLPSIWLNELFS
ncbi:MAG: signal peptidase I [Bacilli bacterium]|nr:signal peptidase I [Bacilli bacterium]